MSIATQIIQDIQDARAQVMVLCNFTEEEMNQHHWDGAMQCLEHVLQSDAHGMAELPKNKAFWIWWREQWYRRDVQFIDALLMDTTLMKYTCTLPGTRTRVLLVSTRAIQTMYLAYHRMTADNPLVNNRNMEVSFHCMIKSITSSPRPSPPRENLTK